MPTRAEDHQLKELLQKCRIIAVVGLSPNPGRTSHRIARYLQGQGYRIIPVHPEGDEILGERVYRRLEDIPLPVDIVYIFRNSDDVLPFVESSCPLQPLAIWLPYGVWSQEAAEEAARKGTPIIMDRCMKVEHHRLLGS